jgi:hypothetical protein
MISITAGGVCIRRWYLVFLWCRGCSGRGVRGGKGQRARSELPVNSYRRSRYAWRWELGDGRWRLRCALHSVSSIFDLRSSSYTTTGQRDKGEGLQDHKTTRPQDHETTEKSERRTLNAELRTSNGERQSRRPRDYRTTSEGVRDDTLINADAQRYELPCGLTSDTLLADGQASQGKARSG